MAEVGRADLVIVPKFDNLGRTVENELSGVGAAAGKSVGSQMAGGVSSSLKGNVVTGAVMGVASNLAGAVAGVATRAVSDAFSGFAEHEQLIGGVETLYGDAASKVVEKADSAFETLGVSANEYMDQTIKYAGSLLKALDGNTEAAATYADKAIQAQRDNVAKLGTDAQMVENAFVGLTRGNFMMIDNLALGYSGTAQGMADLLNDSGVLADGIVADAKNVKDFGFDVMIDAIMATQDRLGITGTAMLEGSQTISGSIDRLKASYSNFTTGLMDDTADVGRLTDELIKSAMVVAGNVAPKVASAVTSIFGAVPDVISSVFGEASDALHGLADGFSENDMGGRALDFAASLLEIDENLMSITKRGERAAASTMTFADAASRAAVAAGSIKVDAADFDISDVIDRSTRALDDYISVNRSAQDELTDLYANSVVAEGYERQIEALLDIASALDENGNRVGLNAEQQKELTAAVQGYNEASGQQWSITDATNGILADEAGNAAATAQEYRNLAEAKELAAAAGTYRSIADEYTAQQAKAQIAVNEAQETYNRLLDEASPKVKEMIQSYQDQGWSGTGLDLGEWIESIIGMRSLDPFTSMEDIESYNRLVDALSALYDAEVALDGATQSGAQAQSLYQFMSAASADGTDEITRRVAELSPVLIGATSDLGGLSDALRLAGVSSDELAGMTDEQLLAVAQAYDGTAMSVVNSLASMSMGVTEFHDEARAKLADLAFGGDSNFIFSANIGDYELDSLYANMDKLSEAYAEQEQNAIGFVRAQHEIGAGYTDMGDLVIAALNEASNAGIAFEGMNGDINEVWASAETMKVALDEAGISFESLNGIDTSAFLAAIQASGGSVDALVTSLVQMAEQGDTASETFGAVEEAAAGVDTSSVDALADSYDSVTESATAASDAMSGADTGGAELAVSVSLNTDEYDTWIAEHGDKPVDTDLSTDDYDTWEGETGEKPVSAEVDQEKFSEWLAEIGVKKVSIEQDSEYYDTWLAVVDTKHAIADVDTGTFEEWLLQDGRSVPVDADLNTDSVNTAIAALGENPGTVPVLVQVDDDSVAGVQTRVSALPGEIVGEPVYVGVEGDYSLYEAQLQILRESGEVATVTATVKATGDPDHPWVVTALDGESYSAFAEINVTANTEDAETALQNVSTAVSDLVAQDHTVTINFVNKWGGIEEGTGSLEDYVSGNGQMQVEDTLMVTVDADTSSAQTKIDTLSDNFGTEEARTFLLLFDADGSGALDTADEVFEAATQLGMTEEEIKFLADGTAAQDVIDKLRSQLEYMVSTKQTVTVYGDTSDAFAKIISLQSQLDSMSWYRTLTIRTVNVEATGNATGAVIAEHASGGYIVDRPTIVSTAGGMIHVAGEAGAEYVEHAGGATTIVPLTNSSYMRPIAKAIADNMEGAGNVTYNLYVDGAQVNSTPAIQGVMMDFFNTLSQEGAM